MSPLWYWSRRTVRARARSYLGLAVLLALLGGLTMASLAGARRTASAYPRFREAGDAFDVWVNAGDFEVQNREAAGSVPGVVRTSIYAAVLGYPLLPEGGWDFEFSDVEAAVSLDGAYLSTDRFVATEGRPPRPDRADEAVVNEHAARSHGIRVGQRFDLGVYDPAEEEAVYGETPPPPLERLTVSIVGIGVFPDEVVQDDTDRISRMLMTPAAGERLGHLATYGWTGVQLSRGAAGVEDFKREYLRLLPEEHPASFRETSLVIARTQEAIRPLAVALGVFGVLAAIALFLLGGQAVVRLLRVDRDDLSTLRAMGAAPRLASAVGLPGVVAGILAGAAGAVAVAVILSSWTPIGPLRRIEVDPRRSYDWTVLGVGAAAIVLGLFAAGVVTAVRQTPRNPTRGGVASPRRSLIASSVSAAGLPMPAVTGMRLALETGEGRTAVPVRATLGAAIAAVTALVAALVFGTSLQSLVDEPRLYGWDWDLTVVDQSGYGSIDMAKADAALASEQAVVAWSPMYFQSVELEGRTLPAIGLEPGAKVRPPVVSGRPVLDRGEVVLGRSTLEELHKRVGETVVVGSGPESQRLRIVGSAVLPTVGPVLGGYTSLGDGMILAYDQVPGWDFISPDPKALLIRLADGVDRAAATERVDRLIRDIGGFPGTGEDPGSALLVPVQRPAEIVNYSSMGATPALLAGTLLLAALVSLGLTLASGVARRRRDLSVLKSMGFTRRQVSGVVVWQSSIIVAVGLLVGIPLGVAVGRWMWILFAERLPVVAAPTVPLVALAALGIGLVVVANLVAAVPARSAGRTPVASVLRSE